MKNEEAIPSIAEPTCPLASNIDVEHQVAHCRQRHSWDCGVACVCMLLPTADREDLQQRLDTVAQEEGFHKSTWTIDLCYLLQRYGIEHSMYTTFMGVNEDYRRHSYYNRILDLDRERVRKRFAEAPARGLQVYQGRISCEELARHVAQRGPALALVHAALLVCDLCKRNKLRAELSRWFGAGSDYRGHYILIVGLRAGKLLYRDPATSARVCAAAPARLRAARRAAGTDEDVVLVRHRFA